MARHSRCREHASRRIPHYTLGHPDWSPWKIGTRYRCHGQSTRPSSTLRSPSGPPSCRTRKKQALTLGSSEGHFIPAARACATRSRSKGSLVSPGKASTPTECSAVYGSKGPYLPAKLIVFTVDRTSPWKQFKLLDRDLRCHNGMLRIRKQRHRNLIEFPQRCAGRDRKAQSLKKRRGPE
jgi:hypothetical protein